MSNETNMCGNSAKLREALIKAITMLAVCEWPDGTNMEGVEELRRDIDAALAEPARNCDVYSADELKDIFKRELASELPIANDHEKNLVTITAMGVINTLFATTKEGGNDGNK